MSDEERVEAQEPAGEVNAEATPSEEASEETSEEASADDVPAEETEE
jgi:hypothetical protein